VRPPSDGIAKRHWGVRREASVHLHPMNFTTKTHMVARGGGRDRGLAARQ